MYINVQYAFNKHALPISKDLFNNTPYARKIDTHLNGISTKTIYTSVLSYFSIL